jgi:hypothetical protein
LEEPANTEKFLHGDFHCFLRGPSHAELIAFAVRAKRFVEVLLALKERRDRRDRRDGADGRG